MNEVLKQIEEIGIVPVVVLDDAKDAEPLAQALCDGGLPCAEVTFRTAAAEESIRIMSEKFPQMLVGAGTVLTTDQVDRAAAAGAKFIVSPGLNPRIVKYCVEKGIPVTPGCANPSDVEQAIENGLDVVKFFPAEQAGGLAYACHRRGDSPAFFFQKSKHVFSPFMTVLCGIRQIHIPAYPHIPFVSQEHRSPRNKKLSECILSHTKQKR